MQYHMRNGHDVADAYGSDARERFGGCMRGTYGINGLQRRAVHDRHADTDANECIASNAASNRKRDRGGIARSARRRKRQPKHCEPNACANCCDDRCVTDDGKW